MKPEVAKAVEELKQAFPLSVVTVSDDGEGGSYVIVEAVDLGNRFVPQETWMGGHIPALYPYADIYPVFIDAGVRRKDGNGFQVPVTNGHTFQDRPAIQISRRNNRIQNCPQTAVAKFLKIIDFMENLQ